MKRVVLTILVLAFSLFSISAFAAGPVYNWNGFYVGLQGLYADGHGDMGTDWKYVSGGERADHSIDGWMGGGFIGYNYHFPFNLVMGIETDINAGDISGTGSCPGPGWACGTEMSWLGATRFRVGYAFYRFLPYIAIGGAYSQAKIYTQEIGISTKYGERNIYYGWTPAAGLEFAITNNLLARLEYSYYDFGKERSEVDYDLLVDTKIKFHTVKFGLSWKF